MEFIKTAQLTNSQKTTVLEIWNKEAPQNIAHHSLESFDKYLASLPDAMHTLIVDINKNIIGWFADFNRDGERWFAMLLNSNIHGKGLGSKLLTLAKENHKLLNGWVIDHGNDKLSNGMPYPSPISFYLKNDFETISDVRLELEHLSCVKIRWRKNT